MKKVKENESMDELWMFLLACIVSVLHQDEGGIGKSIPDAWEISRDPREISRVDMLHYVMV